VGHKVELGKLRIPEHFKRFLLLAMLEVGDELK
jgi:hypothetical protein